MRAAETGQIIEAISLMLGEGEIRGRTALGQLSQAGDEPFRVLISTILSHRTRDEVTSAVSRELFRNYPGPEELANAEEEEVRKVIRRIGFYRVKARRIIEVSRILVEKFGGRVPSDMETLTSLPSVGRKTANCVLVYAFGKPAIPVDTHVHRIMNRLGVVSTRTPEQTEEELRRRVDEKYWLRINEYFVRFGQTICRPIGPRCGICTLSSGCVAFQKGFVKANSGYGSGTKLA